MTEPLVPEPDTVTGRTPEEYAAAASCVAAAREQVLGGAAGTARAVHDALTARIEAWLAATSGES